MREKAEHVVCPHCDTVNRIPTDRPASEAKCGRCHRRIFTRAPIPVSAKSFMAHIKHNDIPVVVDFWAEWCGPCKAMAPIYARIAAELEPEVRFLKVDVEAEKDIAARYNIRSIPTLMLFRKGAVVAQRAGAVDAATLHMWIRQHLVVGASPAAQAS
jgi:thioredoxin 2